MTLNAILEKATELSADDYLVVGIATCFRREESELETIRVLEPVPSAYLESLLHGIPTSYEAIWGTTVGELLNSAEGTWQGHTDLYQCENFSDRVIAAARTYRSRQSAQEIVPLGKSRSDLNFSTEKKRVLNFKNVVTKEDNVRQHKYTHQKL